MIMMRIMIVMMMMKISECDDVWKYAGSIECFIGGHLYCTVQCTMYY
jgi:hypothetical protein